MSIGMVVGCQNKVGSAMRTRNIASEKEVRVADPTSGLHPRVKLETTLGDITLELDAEKAPATTLHFLQFLEQKTYDGTIFHRVRKDFLIQGGVFKPDMTRRSLRLPPGPFPGWSHALPCRRGSIALLHGPPPQGGAGAEFFISLVDREEPPRRQTHPRFAVFGRVVKGMETVERIANTAVGADPRYAAGRSAVVPADPIVIHSARLISAFDRAQVAATVEDILERARDPLGKLVKELERKSGRKVVTTDSGLRYVDLVVGNGPQPLPTDTVEFQYRGTLLDGTEFESTYLTQPLTRRVNTLITGLQEALTTMNEGGRRTVIIPPELAYGPGGIPGRIPGQAILVFEIELLSIP